jgi:hypothetical protein
MRFIVPGPERIQKFHAYPLANESPACPFTPRESDTVTHSPAEKFPDGVKRTRVFAFSIWNCPAIMPDHFPQTITVDVLMDVGSMGESKFTTI